MFSDAPISFAGYIQLDDALKNHQASLYDMEFYRSRRNTLHLKYCDNMFAINNVRKKTSVVYEYWRCMLYSKYHCRVSLKSVDNKIKENGQVHNHSSPDISYIQKNFNRIDGIPDLME